MTSRHRARWLAALSAAFVTGGAWGAPLLAQEMPKGVYERIAFDAADTDGDGIITEAEMTRDAARGFATLDKDGSGTLTPDELGPHDHALFERVDANGDGILTFSEVMTNKVRALGQGDRDDDGGLSFDEMVEVVQSETGEAP
ncbi:EF-hand domain-containing protein [Marinivivus vitaminiproducens]|uniref:EF-hand domain-containing protein n=1 Tax=Marinivivus vitaminiproducens TaxID=3035935 RepID=UPI00279E381D|nr:EF-hand domain-containing protein [Geminicoccaceae bacterium SCSIO 64248]